MSSRRDDLLVKGISAEQLKGLASSGVLFDRENDHDWVDQTTCRKIASVAKVDDEKCESFSYFLKEIVYAANLNSYLAITARDQELKKRRQLQRVAKAAKNLMSRLDQLDYRGQDSLAFAQAALQRFGTIGEAQITKIISHELLKREQEMIERIPIFVAEQMAQASSMIEQLYLAAQYQDMPTSRHGGRPRRDRQPRLYDSDYSPLDQLVESLEFAILSHGGKTSLNKNDGSGTLGDILRELNTFLPREILPRYVTNSDFCVSLNGLHRISVARIAGQKRFHDPSDLGHKRIKTRQKILEFSS